VCASYGYLGADLWLVAQGKLISGSVDWSMSVWDTWTCNCEAKLVRHQGAVCALEVASGRLFSGSVCVWDMVGWTCLHVLEGHSKSVFVLKALGNWLLSGSDDGSIKVWMLDELLEPASASARSLGEGADCGTAAAQDAAPCDKILPIHTLTDHSKAVCALEAHGQHIFSGSFDGTIRVWDRDTLVCKQILKGHQGGVCTMVVCAGRLVSGSTDIRVWRLEDLSLERILQGHNGGVNELAVAENKLLGGFDDALIRVWDTTTWEVERVLEGHVGKFSRVVLGRVGCGRICTEGAGRPAAVLGQCPSLAHLDLGGKVPKFQACVCRAVPVGRI